MTTTAGELAVAPLAAADIEAVVSLWQRCGLTRPWNDPQADIARAIAGPASAVLVGKAGGAVAATVMVGHDGHRGWFYYLGVDPAFAGRGFGRRMTRAAEAWLVARGIPKAMLLIRAENDKVRGFYEALGYAVEPRILMTRWLDGRERPE